MTKPLQLAGLLLLGSLIPSAPAAEAPAPDPAARAAEMRKLADSVKLQSGEVTLRGGIAKAKLPDTLRFVSAHDAQTVLTKIWGNPKDDDILGLIVPANFDALADESWAVVMTFDEDGYVKDDDAAKIDYTKMLAEMKEGVREASKARVKEGYSSIELIGWAAPPRYDSAAKKLYWAKELKFGESNEHTLNYNIRMLGRRGVLVLNAVAGMNQLKLVESATPEILKAVDFEPGHRYADYTPGTDKTATYGLAALVAGGIAAKTGLLKALWLGILAFKKVIILGLIALAGSFKKIWGWIRGRKTAEAEAVSEPPSPPAA